MFKVGDRVKRTKTNLGQKDQYPNFIEGNVFTVIRVNSYGVKDENNMNHFQENIKLFDLRDIVQEIVSKEAKNG